MTNKLPLLLAAAVVGALPTAASAAQVSSPLTPYALTTTQYAQNFDTLSSTATTAAPSQLLPAGFQIAETNGTGTSANGSYVAGNGSANTGDTYSFGASGSTERALGTLASGGLTPIAFGGIFSNGLATTISSLTFGYTGEQWRAGTSTAANDLLTFEYSTNATSLSDGTWTRVTALDFTPIKTATTAAALDGNADGNHLDISSTIDNLAIAAGGTFGFRWTDSDAVGSDSALAIDNLNIMAAVTGAGTPAPAVPEPATWGMMVLGLGMAGAALRRRQSVRIALA